jgi:hypothetical protein
VPSIPRKPANQRNTGPSGIVQVLNKAGAKLSGPTPPPHPTPRPRRVSPPSGILGDVCKFLNDYIVLPPTNDTIIAAWVVGAWAADAWDRFPHLAISSPEKRCGKTRLLQLLANITPRASYLCNISPPALYRLIEQEHPTILLDEAQSLQRLDSEVSQVFRELLNAGIERGATVVRCDGKGRTRLVRFSVYGPKVVATIGRLDGVLADRCLPIYMTRRNTTESIQPYWSRIVGPRGKALHDALDGWVDAHLPAMQEVYNTTLPLPMSNDRMADLMHPLVAVLTVAGADLGVLRQYAAGLDQRDREQEMQSPGVRLLAALHEIFNPAAGPADFMPTDTIIRCLLERRDEPWHRWHKGAPITREGLANLLRPYGVRSERNKTQTHKGYFYCHLESAWQHYLPQQLSTT